LILAEQPRKDIHCFTYTHEKTSAPNNTQFAAFLHL
jgi:hypothetical protein